MSPITEIKPYTHRELANYYGICEKTFYRWLQPFQNELGKKNGHFYTVLQVELILAKLGIPHKLNEE